MNCSCREPTPARLQETSHSPVLPPFHSLRPPFSMPPPPLQPPPSATASPLQPVEDSLVLEPPLPIVNSMYPAPSVILNSALPMMEPPSRTSRSIPLEILPSLH